MKQKMGSGKVGVLFLSCAWPQMLPCLKWWIMIFLYLPGRSLIHLWLVGDLKCLTECCCGNNSSRMIWMRKFRSCHLTPTWESELTKGAVVILLRFAPDVPTWNNETFSKKNELYHRENCSWNKYHYNHLTKKQTTTSSSKDFMQNYQTNSSCCAQDSAVFYQHCFSEQLMNTWHPMICLLLQIQLRNLIKSQAQS